MPVSPYPADRPAAWRPPEGTTLSHHGGNLAAAQLRFPDAPQLRFGLPGDEAAWARLGAVLRS